MKTISAFLTTLSFLVLSSHGFSQTKEEYHKELSTYHGNVKEHAHAIASSSSKTKEEHMKHASEVTRNLKEAKKAHASLKKSILKKDTAIAKPYHEAIEKLHTVATYHVTALNEELKKTNPDLAKINESAEKIYELIEKAEKQHKFLEEKTKK